MERHSYAAFGSLSHLHLTLTRAIMESQTEAGKAKTGFISVTSVIDNGTRNTKCVD